jgi:hypothetical protein
MNLGFSRSFGRSSRRLDQTASLRCGCPRYGTSPNSGVSVAFSDHIGCFALCQAEARRLDTGVIMAMTSVAVRYFGSCMLMPFGHTSPAREIWVQELQVVHVELEDPHRPEAFVPEESVR